MSDLEGGHSADGARRRAPRIIDTDWLILRKLKQIIEEVFGRVLKPTQVALDFGCGSKPYESIVVRAGCAYVGADLGDAAGIRINDDGRLGAAGGSADVVLSFQVLEHVRDLQTYFSEAHRVLRPDGLLILSTHGTWLYHPHPEDHRRWTREGLIGDIEANGFEVLECHPVVGPLAWTTVLRLTCWSFALRRIAGVGGLFSAGMALIMNLRAVLEEAITPKWVTRDNACVYVTVSRRREPTDLGDRG